MIRNAADCKVEYREHMRDGNGTVKLTSFIAGPEELNEKGRLFSKITLRSFGTTSRTELSDEPVIVQECIDSHSARWCRSISADFSSIVTGTSSLHSSAISFQKRF